MTNPTPQTIRRRLERAGYASVVVSGKAGWVPVAYAHQVLYQIGAHREDVVKIEQQPPKPRGRPKKA